MKQKEKVTFGNEHALIRAIHELDHESRWFKAKSKDLSFVDPTRKVLEEMTLEELYSHTALLSGAGMYLRFDSKQNDVPISESALTSICQSMGLKGSMLQELKRKDLRILLNKCVLHIKNKDVYINVYNNQAVFMGYSPDHIVWSAEYEQIRRMHRCQMIDFQKTYLIPGNRMVVKFEGEPAICVKENFRKKNQTGISTHKQKIV